jgi:hypothetical protein
VISEEDSSQAVVGRYQVEKALLEVHANPASGIEIVTGNRHVSTSHVKHRTFLP